MVLLVILKVWTGLIGSPFRIRIRIQDQFRIRLQDGYMEHDPGPVHLTPANRKPLCKRDKSNRFGFRNYQNYSFIFGLGPQRRSYWRRSGETISQFFLFYIFFFYYEKKSKAWIGSSRRAWRCRMDPTRKESGKLWGNICQGAREVWLVKGKDAQNGMAFLSSVISKDG